VQCPDKNTVIKAHCWMYFGVRKDESRDADGKEYDKAFDAITHALFGEKKIDQAEKDHRKVEDGFSNLLAFTLDFDCFTFPKSIGQNISLGPEGLNLRSKHKINVAGIYRQKETMSQAPQVEWFPGAEATVSGGDLGIVVRRPCRDGSTKSTITDSDLRSLMEVKQHARA